MKTGGFQRLAGGRKRLGRGRRQWQLSPAHQSVHVEGPEPDTFHVEGSSGPCERFAFDEHCRARRALRLLANDSDEGGNPRFGFLAVGGDVSHGTTLESNVTSCQVSMAEQTGRGRIEAPDLSEKGGLKNGSQQRSDNRLFVQLLAFGGCTDSAAAASSVAAAGITTVVYEDVNDPTGIAILSITSEPDAFLNVLRPRLRQGAFAAMTLKPEYTMLGRTYALGYEPDLDDTLVHRPTRTLLNPAWPWAIWYPLRRNGAFAQLSAEQQRTILAEHGAVGMAFGAADLVHDIRLACHGLDQSDNDFVIGLIGRELFPLSAIVQTMRKTQQTALYLDRLGPFFVGRKISS